MPSGAEHVTTALSPWTTVIGLPGVSDRVRGGGGAVYMRREGERERNYIYILVFVHAIRSISVVRMLLKFHCFQIRKLCLPGL